MPQSLNNPSSDSITRTQESLAAAGAAHQESEFFVPIPPGYEKGKHKFVVVLGTVMSGLGKGIFSSSLAKILKNKGLSVAPIKMEGYLNIDSGTLNPYRHGEVFVLDDGMETDMDLGTYERMLDQNLTGDNFVTSGQIFRHVLDKERDGGYLGRDVQMIPHVTGEVKYKLRDLAMKQNADVVFVEVGGTVGDYENAFYIEALRELAFEEGPGSTCFVALTYIIEPQALGEQKSKAAQLGLKKVMEAGIQPHIVACRARNPVEDTAREKIAMFSNVPMNRVFSMHDRDSIYSIPDAMHDSALDVEVLSMLNLHSRVNPRHEDKARAQWGSYVRKLTETRKYKPRIGITGKYAALRDAYASIDKALEHCGTHLSADIDIQWIDTTEMQAGKEDQQAADLLADLDGVIVPGGFGVRGTEGKVACVKYCRENKLPYLGICLGFQVAVIEYARHIAGITGAGSTEFNPDATAALIDMLPEQKKIEGLGGNMRLGGKEVQLRNNSLASFLFNDANNKPPAQSADQSLISATQPWTESCTTRQRFRHRYEVNPEFIEQLEHAGLIFSGRHPKHPIMQILELPFDQHPYFVAGQFHPELTSRPLNPQPMFMGLVAAAIAKANPTLSREEVSDRWLPFDKAAAKSKPDLAAWAT